MPTRRAAETYVRSIQGVRAGFYYAVYTPGTRKRTGSQAVRVCLGWRVPTWSWATNRAAEEERRVLDFSGVTGGMPMRRRRDKDFANK